MKLDFMFFYVLTLQTSKERKKFYNFSKLYIRCLTPSSKSFGDSSRAVKVTTIWFYLSMLGDAYLVQLSQLTLVQLTYGQICPPIFGKLDISTGVGDSFLYLG